MHTLRLLWAACNENAWTGRQRRYRARQELEIENMSEVLFIEHFRLNKNTFRRLCRDLRAHTRLKGTLEISLEIKVLCTLSFLATGSYQRIVGAGIHLTQRTTSRCIRQVVDALNQNPIMEKWIIFPTTPQERSRIKENFQRKYNLPGVIGCIDCTHIAIVKPIENEHDYYNRKGYHSLNVQMVCDDDLRITSINAKFGGATHDSHIWSASHDLESHMRRLHENGERVWLLGDSGYPQRPWLMTPILNTERGSREEVYTSRHVQARSCIERYFGLLKSRWRCLLRDRVLHYIEPAVAVKITLACCVLHNIAINARLPPPSNTSVVISNINDSVAPAESENHSELIRGRAMRNYLISRM